MSLIGGSSEETPAEQAGGDDPPADGVQSSSARVGEYTWEEFFAEFDEDAVRLSEGEPGSGGVADELGWRSDLDPSELLGFDPREIKAVLEEANDVGARLDHATYDTLDPEDTPVRQGEWTWHHFVREFHEASYSEVALPDDFEAAKWLGFPEAELEPRLGAGAAAAEKLAEIVPERTVNVHPDLDEDAFFRTPDGETTIVNRYDLEKAVPFEKKRHFRELERYWVNKPYAFVIIFISEKENETKYYLIEPYETEIEADLLEFLSGKLRTSIKYADRVAEETEELDRREVIERETMRLLGRYDIYTESSDDAGGIGTRLKTLLGREAEEFDLEERGVEGIEARPEPALLAEDASSLSEYQVEKLLYRLTRDFIGYERIDGIKHDINVEDISCDGYNSPVFVYHTEYEQIISNVYHGEQRLDDFVVKLAQRSGKGISKRQPQVDATLPDGSRAQLTLGKEVSDHGTNYTIRQFKDVPFTPIDLINWRTFSLEQMAFLWLCIENHKSLIFAGGTASGKTTSLNAVSLFIPSNSKIVSIEDTREVELPQRNWIASVTRPSFSDDEKGEVDEFDLLEAALRQRPEYIVMGEIRGEEGRTLFQVMSTGHTTYTTFHADSVGEVLKRFTTAPINVSKTMFTALDLVSIQTSTRVRGHKVRRNKSLTEINHYETENDEINVQDVYQWQAEYDEFLRLGDSNTLDEILFDRGWDRERLDEEIFKREVVLAYLIQKGLNEYREVAATLQAFINDPDKIFALIANGKLEDSLEDLREMESVLIDVDPEKEELVPRPDPDEEMVEHTQEILARAEEELFPKYSDENVDGSVAEALIAGGAEREITAEPGGGEEMRAAIEEAAEQRIEKTDPVPVSTTDGEQGDGQTVAEDPDAVHDSEAHAESTVENDAWAEGNDVGGPKVDERDDTETVPAAAAQDRPESMDPDRDTSSDREQSSQPAASTGIDRFTPEEYGDHSIEPSTADEDADSQLDSITETQRPREAERDRWDPESSAARHRSEVGEDPSGTIDVVDESDAPWRAEDEDVRIGTYVDDATSFEVSNDAADRWRAEDAQRGRDETDDAPETEFPAESIDRPGSVDDSDDEDGPNRSADDEGGPAEFDESADRTDAGE